MPFTHEAFLDVFGAYNALLWPFEVLLWAATTVVVWNWIRSGGARTRALFALLAIHWGWSGIAYHWSFFRDINPAATMFAAAFMLQALLLGWLAAGARAPHTTTFGLRGLIGIALIVYGLIYPLLGFGFGLTYPRMPLFAVPCPTTLVTAGVLITTTGGAPRFVAVLPILWAIVGSSAAFALGIQADLALIGAGALLAIDMFAPSAFGRRVRYCPSRSLSLQGCCRPTEAQIERRHDDHVEQRGRRQPAEDDDGHRRLNFAPGLAPAERKRDSASPAAMAVIRIGTSRSLAPRSTASRKSVTPSSCIRC